MHTASDSWWIASITYIINKQSLERIIYAQMANPSEINQISVLVTQKCKPIVAPQLSSNDSFKKTHATQLLYWMMIKNKMKPNEWGLFLMEDRSNII